MDLMQETFLKENNLIHKEFRQLFQIHRWRVWRTVSCISEANKITHNIHQLIQRLLRTQVQGVVHPKMKIVIIYSPSHISKAVRLTFICET